METHDNHDIILFESPTDWRGWLDVNHGRNKGLWLKLSKKSATYPSLTYDQALEEALCYGWIDGQKQSYSDEYFLQKFTQRRSKSIWSKRNVALAEILETANRMHPAGRLEITKAKSDGRWDRAYDGARSIKMTAEFETALAGNPVAQKFFHSLNRANSYAILWRIQTAKSVEARTANINKYIAMLERGERIH
jgi:uncharacterized protein YdeI (YjbR/CyaY-like superfamily)